MSTGKKISTFIIFSIVLIIYFFGYNYDYKSSYIISVVFFLLLLFSYVGLTLSTYERIAGENPGSFFFNPWKKIRYIVLSSLLTITLVILIFSTIFISLELSKNRKNKFLNSSETKNIEGLISKTDSIPQRYGKRPVAYLNYKINDNDYDFELSNPDGKYKVKQKVKLKYSLEHPDMFEILE
jgi:hypothetical protein